MVNRLVGSREVLVGVALVLALCALPGTAAAQSFVKFETPQVHPLEGTPDGQRLLAVNTADGRLEVFDLTSTNPTLLASIPVGLEPVSVRARNNQEVWVANLLSDSISVVDLAAGNVVDTVQTSDEPCDIVFAGNPQRAFVSCSQANLIEVFDPDDLSSAPSVLPIQGEDPRALAVSPDGGTVYVAMFEAGNGTTILPTGFLPPGAFVYPPNVVSLPGTPHGGANPPPNGNGVFVPPQNPANPPPPEAALIVRKASDGSWLDDTGADWADWVSGPLADASGRVTGWDLADHDLAIIDSNTLAVSYAGGFLNANMALAINPATGVVAVVGTDATNEIRFIPNLQGTFIRVLVALVDPSGGGAPTSTVQDLNPHLDYTTPSVPQAVRDLSLGDPRGIAFSADGSKAWVAGMGSNNLIVLDAGGARTGPVSSIEVGQGPTGLVVDDTRMRVYVLNRFEASISVVDTTTSLETVRVPFFDPTPQAIVLGRPFLYSTHDTSGLGQLACGSCHIDSRWDSLAWDLGDPSDVVTVTPSSPLQNFDGNNPNLVKQDPPPDFHPMKGPMTTQTLQDIIGQEPLHWRGDQDGLEGFNGAFTALQGDDTMLTPAEMQLFEDFLATIHYPPNPYRMLDNSLPRVLPLPGHVATGLAAPAGTPLPAGDAQAGLARFVDAMAGACTRCHTMPTGSGTDTSWDGSQFAPIPAGPLGERHLAISSAQLRSTIRPNKIPTLRPVYEKLGFDTTKAVNTRGFGLTHDGAVDSLARFVGLALIRDKGIVGDIHAVADMAAFLLCFSGSDLPVGDPTNPDLPPGPLSQDAHAATGRQETFASTDGAPGQVAMLSTFMGLADAGATGLVVKGRRTSEARGYAYVGGGSFQSDRATEVESLVSLLAAAGPGTEFTFTVVPLGTETRLGVDRDEDGFFDRDELDASSDPADPTSIPGSWVDLGQGLAGTPGVPVLQGSGPMLPESDIVLSMSGALPSAAAVAIAGFSEAGAQLLGGVLVPSPEIIVLGIPVDGSGALILQATIPPAGFPSGTEVFFQLWIADPGGPQGYAATNGLRATVP